MPSSLATIGHSTRTLEDFVAILQAHGIELVADVRTIPRSRRVPWFDAGALAAGLPRFALAYVHLPRLGGLRKAGAGAANAGWRNASFRGYADHMQTPEFAAGLEELMRLCRERSTAILCAEAVPWRCHRSLIADALLARGFAVRHLMSRTSAHAHELTPFAKLCGERISYPPPA